MGRVARTMALTVALALALAGMTAAPASADAPEEFTDSVTFVDINPCDPPSTHEVTIVSHIKLHEHRNNTVVVIDAETSTDDGFSGFGHTTEVARGGVLRGTFNYVQAHAEKGQKFTVKAHYVVDLETDEFLVDTFRFHCVKS